MSTSKKLHERRQRRVRHSIKVKAPGALRLSVFRSGQHIYAQVIDDGAGRTVAAASTVDKSLRGKNKTTTTKDAAKAVGLLVAERTLKAGVKAVVFDRGGYLFHGRVQALAEGAREGGLVF